MAELSWNTTAPLQTVAEAGRHGLSSGEAGVVVGEIRRFQLCLVMARHGAGAAARSTAKAQFGADPGEKPKAVAGKNGSRLIWSAPDQFFVLTPAAKTKPLDRLQKAFAKKASISEQSNGRSLFRMSGPRVRDCLAKLLSIDLHPDVFAPGAAAATQMGHISVNVWRDEEDAFNLLVFTSFAESLWRDVLAHGAEYGVEIVPPFDLG